VLATADVICQRLEGAEPSVRRAASMAVTGGVLVGPALHAWYGFLGRRLGESSALVVVAKKLVLDQAFFAPVMFASIMSSSALLNGRSAQQTAQKIHAEFPTVLSRSWMVWPLATALNFAFVPPPYRVLVNNGVSCCWNTYLSYVNNRPLPVQAQPQPMPSPLSDQSVQPFT